MLINYKVTLKINIRSIIIVIGVFLCLLVTIIPLQPVQADDVDACGAGGVGEENVEEYVPGPASLYILEQPFANRSGVQTLGEYIQLVYSYAAGLIGIMAVVLIMAGGMIWITAAGNEQKISKAKEIIVSAAIAVLIIVLSYLILIYINPQFKKLDITVQKIPIQSGCSYDPPEIVSIPSHPNLTGSGQLCAGAAEALVKIADKLGSLCSTCKIGISSTYRSPESQEPLYACYQKAVEAGYFSGSTKIKAGCPTDSGCTSCNLAAKPCCSNHQKGLAIDAWFEVTGMAGTAETSQGYLKQEWNGGGNPKNAELESNQKILTAAMETSIDGQKYFSGITKEWWHFDFKGRCEGVSTGDCNNRVIVSSNYASAESYCRKSATELAYGICDSYQVNLPPICPSGYTLVNPGNCTDLTKRQTFDETHRTNSSLKTTEAARYDQAPTCLAR